MTEPRRSARTAVRRQQERFREFVANLAGALFGRQWRLRERDGRWATLYGDDVALDIKVIQQNGQTLVSVRGIAPDDLDVRNLASHYLTAPMYESAVDLAKRIKERLLPSYRTAVQAAREQAESQIAVQHLRSRLAANLAEAAGAAPPAQDSARIRYGSHWQHYSGTASIDPTAETVEFHVSVPASEAIDFIRHITKSRTSHGESSRARQRP